MRVSFDVHQMAALGAPEEVSIDLPDGWPAFTTAQRKAWARQQIQEEMAGFLRDCLAEAGERGAAVEAYIAQAVRDLPADLLP